MKRRYISDEAAKHREERRGPVVIPQSRGMLVTTKGYREAQ